MRDRLRYRAWDKENKRYIYGVEKGLQFYSTAGNLRVMTLAEIEESDKYDLEQCTGLKDKNGKLIYGGDFVEVPVLYNEIPTGKKQRCKVYYKHGAFNIYAVKFEFLKVIGNIHQDSKLLEGE